MWVSRLGVFIWAIVMGCAMSVAQKASINVNFLITIIGALLLSGGDYSTAVQACHRPLIRMPVMSCLRQQQAGLHN